MANGDLYFSLAGGGSRTFFDEAPQLKDADGKLVPMTIGGWGPVGNVSAGLRFDLGQRHVQLGFRVDGSLQGGGQDVLDAIDSNTPEVYYAAPECDSYAQGDNVNGVLNGGNAGNCGIGDPVDLEVAAGFRYDWGLSDAQIMLADAKGMNPFKDVMSVPVELSLTRYLDIDDKTQLGLSAVGRTHINLGGEVQIPGEHLDWEPISGVTNQEVLVRAELRFADISFDFKGGGSARTSTIDKKEGRAKERKKREETARNVAIARNITSPTATTSTPSPDPKYPPLPTNHNELERGKAYATSGGIDKIAFNSYPYHSVSPLPTGFKEQTMVLGSGVTMVLDSGVTFDASGISFDSSATVLKFFTDKDLPTLIHNYAAGEDKVTIKMSIIFGANNLRKEINNLLIQAGNQSGVDKAGYARLMEKLATNFEALPSGLVPRKNDMAALFREVAGIVVVPPGSDLNNTPQIQFPNTSATFTVGSSATFDFTGDASQIEHIECLKDSKVLDTKVDYTTTDTTLTVTGLAEISSKVKADAIAAIPTSDNTTVRNAKTSRAGKGDYTLVVILENNTEITLTATAQ